MPPSPQDGPPGSAAASSPPASYRPDPANTRVLLRSLEELRDSLSTRVEQLSAAVDRLRGQASDLERAVATGTALAPGFGRPSSTQIDPLPPPPPVPTRNRVSVTTTTTTTVSAAESPDISIANSRFDRMLRARIATYNNILDSRDRRRIAAGLPTMADEGVRIVQAENRGCMPTNLAQVATQPKPIIVRSESLPVPEPLPEVEVAAAETELPLQFPVDPPSSEVWSGVVRPRTPPSTARLFPQRPDGMTTRGMLVEERQGRPVLAPSDTGRREIDMLDRLDRAIARHRRRQDESNREYQAAWEQERIRAIHSGRVPNEHSSARAEAMRRNVDNAHRLWHLTHQRERLLSRRNDEQPPSNALHHIMVTSPTFLRGNRRRSSTAAGVPASPPRRLPAEVTGHPLLAHNMERWDLGPPLRDYSDYDFYRGILSEQRRRIRDEDEMRSRIDALAQRIQVQDDEYGSSEFSLDSPMDQRALLDFLEESRAAAREDARALSRSDFEAERPNMRRMVESIERMLSRSDLTAESRSRLEALVERERDLLGEPTRRRIARPVFESSDRASEDLPPHLRERLEAYNTVSDEEEPLDVVERIARARTRLQELFRLSNDLRDARAEMGLDRRGSDTDTVVPTSPAGFHVVDLNEAVRTLSLDPGARQAAENREAERAARREVDDQRAEADERRRALAPSPRTLEDPEETTRHGYPTPVRAAMRRLGVQPYEAPSNSATVASSELDRSRTGSAAALYPAPTLDAHTEALDEVVSRTLVSPAPSSNASSTPSISSSEASGSSAEQTSSAPIPVPSSSSHFTTEYDTMHPDWQLIPPTFQEEEEEKRDEVESGALGAEAWPSHAARLRDRPYVSLLDL